MGVSANLHHSSGGAGSAGAGCRSMLCRAIAVTVVPGSELRGSRSHLHRRYAWSVSVQAVCLRDSLCLDVLKKVALRDVSGSHLPSKLHSCPVWNI